MLRLQDQVGQLAGLGKSGEEAIFFVFPVIILDKTVN